MFGLKNRKEQEIVVKEETAIRRAVYLIAPERIVAIKGRSQLSFETWYRAIYMIASNPDVKAHVLSKELNIAWVTARNMIIPITSELASNK